MDERLEDELYENGQHSQRTYSNHTESELGSVYEDAYVLFEPGDIRLYQGARVILEKSDTTWQELVVRHLQGEFGDIAEQVREHNDLAIRNQYGSVVSRYAFTEGKIEVSTDLIERLTRIIS